MKTRILIICMVVLSLVVLIPQASACSCIEPNIEDAFAEADNLIFSGTVTGIKEQQRTYLVTFDIDQTWKGIPNDVTSINTMTAQSSSTCGFNFTENQSYLVEAHGKWDQTPEVSICSSTTNLDFAHEQVSFLNKQTQNDDTDFTAATFADKYQDLLQKGGTRVSVLIKVAGDVESTDPTKRAKEIRYLQSYVLKFLSYTNGINILSNPEKNEITGQIHPHWIEILEKRTDVLSVTILDSNELSKDGIVLSPLKQQKNGIAPNEIKCKEGLVLIIKHNGSPACVTPTTAEKLIERGWALDTSSIDSFEECITAGNPAMESYPRQCRTQDGLHFVEDISNLEVKITGEKQVRRGTAQTIEIQVLRDEVPIQGARVFIDIEDYGEDIIKEFDGYTNFQGNFVFSWEIPQSFDDIEDLLVIVDVTDDISAKTEVFEFQVYCLAGEKDCKVEGN